MPVEDRETKRKGCAVPRQRDAPRHGRLKTRTIMRVGHKWIIPTHSDITIWRLKILLSISSSAAVSGLLMQPPPSPGQQVSKY